MTIQTSKFEVLVDHQSHAGRLAPSRGIYATWGKPALDLLLVLLSAPVVLPVIALLAILVSLDGGPAFYSQLRVGRGGRLFRIWKLRTMIPDAEARLAEHLASDPAARAEWQTTQKLRHDPRITPFGRFLRATSLDELPQLFNVLNGTMSLVGPRPMMVDQQDAYPGLAYFRLRPGITGPWQISDRNACAFSARAVFDNRYERRVSLLTDLTIILRTLGVVLRGTGL